MDEYWVWNSRQSLTCTGSRTCTNGCRQSSLFWFSIFWKFTQSLSITRYAHNDLKRKYLGRHEPKQSVNLQNTCVLGSNWIVRSGVFCLRIGIKTTLILLNLVNASFNTFNQTFTFMWFLCISESQEYRVVQSGCNLKRVKFPFVRLSGTLGAAAGGTPTAVSLTGRLQLKDYLLL